MTDTIEQCSVCGINRINGNFIWSHRSPNNQQVVAKPDQVYSKVCGIAKQKGRDVSGCLNSKGTFQEKDTWKELQTTLTDATRTEASDLFT